MDDIKPLSPDSENIKTSEHLPPRPADPTSMPKRSHLRKTLESKSQQTLLLSLLGIVAIIIFLVFLGPTLIEQLATFTNRNDNDTVKTSDEDISILLPPILDTPYEATNSAEINLSGTAEDGDTVKLYRDGKLTKEAKIKSDNSFIFSGIDLKEGSNNFKAKVFKADKESKFSEPITITYRKGEVKLSIDYPQEGQTISHKDGDRLQIEGTTDPNVNVTINGFQAVVNDEGKFKYVLPVSGGDNTIHAVATDDAGNKTAVERKFTYNQ